LIIYNSVPIVVSAFSHPNLQASKLMEVYERGESVIWLWWDDLCS